MNDPVLPQAAPVNQRDNPLLTTSRWALTLLVFLTFYLGTVGPMAALHRKLKFEPLQKLIEFVYFPIAFAMKREMEPLYSIMRWYVGLFR